MSMKILEDNINEMLDGIDYLSEDTNRKKLTESMKQELNIEIESVSNHVGKFIVILKRIYNTINKTNQNEQINKGNRFDNF